MNKPNKKDIASSFHHYLDLAPDNDLLKNLKVKNETLTIILEGVSKEKEEYKYQPDKWSIKKVACHLIASERYFCDLIVRLSKDERTQQINYPLGKYDVEVNAQKSLTEIIIDSQETRKATIQFFQNFDPDIINNVYTINGNKYSPMGVAYIILGHEIHHSKVIQEKYLV